MIGPTAEAKCYCQSCIDLRERKPEARDVPGHVIVCSDEGTIAYIPVDVVLTDAPRRPAPRNWLKGALR